MDIDRIIETFERRSPARRARIGETVRLWIEESATRRDEASVPAGVVPAYPAFARRPQRAH